MANEGAGATTGNRSPSPTLIIAEIGTSHGGSLSRAAELIGAAAEAGADCAKFQAVYAEEIVHPSTGDVPLPGGAVPLFERFRGLEAGPDFYAELKERTERAGLRFLCTPFGIRSARMLRSIGVSALKIASPELNHLPLLREVAGYGLPLYLSTGVSLIGDIEEALGLLDRRRVTLLHCVTAYPAPPADYNLNLLPALRTLFGTAVGLSDHSLDPLLVPLLSVTQGAQAIEKHITLSRKGPGLDDPVALEPDHFASMVERIRSAEARVATGRTGELLSDLESEFGRNTVAAVLGSGVKELAPSEAANYGRTNRSIHAVHDLPAGHCIEKGDVAVLRTEKVLRPGLHPRHLPIVEGSVLRRPVPAGEGIRWVDLISGCEDVDSQNGA